MTVTYSPLKPGAKITLIYYDQRIRLEGYYVEWMMDAAGIGSPFPALAPASQP